MHLLVPSLVRKKVFAPPSTKQDRKQRTASAAVTQGMAVEDKIEEFASLPYAYSPVSKTKLKYNRSKLACQNSAGRSGMARWHTNVDTWQGAGGQFRGSERKCKISGKWEGVHTQVRAHARHFTLLLQRLLYRTQSVLVLPRAFTKWL